MTAETDFNTFLTQQADPNYTLGDIEGTPEADMIKYTELKIAAEQEKTKIANFNEAKMVAFDALAATHNDEKIALGEVWQAKEDNDFTI